MRHVQHPAHALGIAIAVTIGALGSAAALTLAGGITVQQLGGRLTMPVRFGIIFLFGQLIPFIGIPVAYFYGREMAASQISEYVGISRPSSKEIAVAGGGFVLIFLAVLGISVILRAAGVTPASNAASQSVSSVPSLVPVLIFGMMLVVGPCEEFLFRGTIQNLLREHYHPGYAVAGAGLLFAVSHYFALTGGEGRLLTIGVLLIPGVVFGVVYEYTQNLVVPALSHGLWNSFLLVVIWLSTQLNLG